MCPQSVALGVSPVNRLCGCQVVNSRAEGRRVADAGSIPQFVGGRVQSLDDFSMLTSAQLCSLRSFSFAKPHQLSNGSSGILCFDRAPMVET